MALFEGKYSNQNLRKLTQKRRRIKGVNQAMTSLAEKLQTNPPVKRYRIGEVTRFSGLSRQTVHNYTIMGLITEGEWTEGGHRLYDESVFQTLVRIEKLKKTLSLREIREKLNQEQGRNIEDGLEAQ